MRSKKALILTITVLVIGLLSMGLLAACGEEETTTTAAPTETTAAPTETTAAPTETTAAAAPRPLPQPAASTAKSSSAPSRP